ncbi:MAG: aldo/keto reductase [Terriglobia bacterium]
MKMRTEAALTSADRELARHTDLGHGLRPVMRLGLAARGNTHLTPEDVAFAVERGVNYLNSCGYDDGIARALRGGLIDRGKVVVATQLGGRTARSMRKSLDRFLELIGGNSCDVVTLYYVEEESEWKEIIEPAGAMETLEEARNSGQIRMIGLTSHQRKFAARWAESGKLDLLMIRYNAAHRGAEEDVFPAAERLGIPVVTYTAQRWGALKKRTPGDPEGFKPPHAREWYRWALAHPRAGVVLMAPANRQELEENLQLLDDWRAPSPENFAALAAHGRRVRHHAVVFW